MQLRSLEVEFEGLVELRAEKLGAQSWSVGEVNRGLEELGSSETFGVQKRLEK